MIAALNQAVYLLTIQTRRENITRMMYLVQDAKYWQADLSLKTFKKVPYLFEKIKFLKFLNNWISKNSRDQTLKSIRRMRVFLGHKIERNRRCRI
jgi:hypothetical protein